MLGVNCVAGFWWLVLIWGFCRCLIWDLGCLPYCGSCGMVYRRFCVGLVLLVVAVLPDLLFECGGRIVDDLVAG